MNTPHEPHDPLLESLADEAADLPLRAAHEARSRKARHMQWRFRAACAVTILLVSICSRSLITTPGPRPASVPVAPASAASDPDKPTASSEPIAPEAPDSPSLSPTPMIASSKPTRPPRPDDPHAQPVPAAPVASHPLVSSAALANDPSGALPREFVKVQTEEEAMGNPLPLPEGLDQEQQELFKAARGLPLLLVRDRAGKVLRIHVIER